MATPRRVLRLQRVVLETVATAILRDLQDPRLGFVTITRARLSPDLTEATVYWSSLGTDAQRRTCARALSDARGRIQSIVARALATRTTPVLTFRYDPTLVKAERLEEIFEKIKTEPGHEPHAGDDASPAARTDDTPAAAPEGDDAADVGAADDAAPAGGSDSSDVPADEPAKKPWKRKKPRKPRA
jgi:ribosome-binding factor A